MERYETFISVRNTLHKVFVLVCSYEISFHETLYDIDIEQFCSLPLL